MDGFSFPSPTAAAVPGSAAPPFPPPWFLAAVAEDEDGGGGGDEKMDMLWEDFNEELARAAPVRPLSPLHGDGGGGLMTMAMMKDAAWLDSDSDGDVGGGRGPEGKRRRHYMVVRRRRWSLVLMLRLLKKLFLAKKSSSQRTAPL